jgi:hypothetical protein
MCEIAATTLFFFFFMCAATQNERLFTLQRVPHPPCYEAAASLPICFFRLSDVPLVVMKAQVFLPCPTSPSPFFFVGSLVPL